VTLTAAFPLAAHERIVLAFHASGDPRDAREDRIGKTIFAQLLASIPRPRRRMAEEY
jgi:hypothetical protein